MRDAVALTVSGPRFLTLGDEARLELAVHNVEGPAGAYSVTGQYESEPGAQSQPRLRARGCAQAPASASARPSSSSPARSG